MAEPPVMTQAATDFDPPGDPSAASILGAMFDVRRHDPVWLHNLSVAGQRVEVLFSSAPLEEIYGPSLTQLEVGIPIRWPNAALERRNFSEALRVLVFQSDVADPTPFAEQVRSSLNPAVLSGEASARFQFGGPDPEEPWSLIFYDAHRRLATY